MRLHSKPKSRKTRFEAFSFRFTINKKVEAWKYPFYPECRKCYRVVCKFVCVLNWPYEAAAEPTGPAAALGFREVTGAHAEECAGSFCDKVYRTKSEAGSGKAMIGGPAAGSPPCEGVGRVCANRGESRKALAAGSAKCNRPYWI